MSIVEVTRTYNLMPILKESIEISKFNFQRSLEMGGGCRPDENMVVFGFGRQCGHSSTIVELLLSDNSLNNKTIVVSPNRLCADMLRKRSGVRNTLSIQNRHDIINKFIGHSEDFGIIFDSCSHRDIEKFFADLFPCIRRFELLKFVVNVAPIW